MHRQPTPYMIRIEMQVELNYEVDCYGADFIFNIHAAHTAAQSVSAERLNLSQPVQPQIYTEPISGNRFMRVRALPGPLKLRYGATVDLNHLRADPAQIAEVPVARLPPEVLGYLYPSRYCQSDRLVALATKEFGSLWQGYGRVLAIQDWVRRHVTFRSNTTNSNTSALDTLVDQVGVCRDFAHLMIALCRALNLPARFATGLDYGADPALGPPDFHASTFIRKHCPHASVGMPAPKSAGAMTVSRTQSSLAPPALGIRPGPHTTAALTRSSCRASACDRTASAPTPCTRSVTEPASSDFALSSAGVPLATTWPRAAACMSTQPRCQRSWGCRSSAPWPFTRKGWTRCVR